jgi:very-short-patch-repair endonuclease
MFQDPRQTQRARDLRQQIVPCEKLLWRALRGRRFAGLKFRRQRPIGPYIVDFNCSARLLVVEIDGEIHIGNEQADRDRQEYLESIGLKVLRFWNTQVYEDLEAVLQAIHDECERRKPKPSPPTPLPEYREWGEDQKFS